MTSVDTQHLVWTHSTTCDERVGGAGRPSPAPETEDHTESIHHRVVPLPFTALVWVEQHTASSLIAPQREAQRAASLRKKIKGRTFLSGPFRGCLVPYWSVLLSGRITVP